MITNVVYITSKEGSKPLGFITTGHVERAIPCSGWGKRLNIQIAVMTMGLLQAGCVFPPNLANGHSPDWPIYLPSISDEDPTSTHPSPAKNLYLTQRKEGKCSKSTHKNIQSHGGKNAAATQRSGIKGSTLPPHSFTTLPSLPDLEHLPDLEPLPNFDLFVQGTNRAPTHQSAPTIGAKKHRRAGKKGRPLKNHAV